MNYRDFYFRQWVLMFIILFTAMQLNAQRTNQSPFINNEVAVDQASIGYKGSINSLSFLPYPSKEGYDYQISSNTDDEYTVIINFANGNSAALLHNNQEGKLVKPQSAISFEPNGDRGYFIGNDTRVYQLSLNKNPSCKAMDMGLNSKTITTNGTFLIGSKIDVSDYLYFYILDLNFQEKIKIEIKDHNQLLNVKSHFAINEVNTSIDGSYALLAVGFYENNELIEQNIASLVIPSTTNELKIINLLSAEVLFPNQKFVIRKSITFSQNTPYLIAFIQEEVKMEAMVVLFNVLSGGKDSRKIPNLKSLCFETEDNSLEIVTKNGLGKIELSLGETPTFSGNVAWTNSTSTLHQRIKNGLRIPNDVAVEVQSEDLKSDCPGIKPLMVKIINNGHQNLNYLSLLIKIDSTEFPVLNWKGKIAPGEEKTIFTYEFVSNIGQKNAIEIVALAPNNKTDLVPKNNLFRSFYKLNIEEEPKILIDTIAKGLVLKSSLPAQNYYWYKDGDLLSKVS